MSRTDFALAPELREFGEELFKALPIRAMTQVARADRGEGGLALTDLMEELRRIERDEFRPEGFLGGIRD